jgi:hypothetical protein
MKTNAVKKSFQFYGQVFVLVLLLGGLFAGCATTPAPFKGSPDLLNFLADDETTRAEVLVTLGQPSGQFAADKILTYRLGYDPGNHGYYPVEREPTPSGWPNWSLAKFSLVLVFDEAGMLRKHSLVKVNQ